MLRLYNNNWVKLADQRRAIDKSTQMYLVSEILLWICWDRPWTSSIWLTLVIEDIQHNRDMISIEHFLISLEKRTMSYHAGFLIVLKSQVEFVCADSYNHSTRADEVFLPCAGSRSAMGRASAALFFSGWGEKCKQKIGLSACLSE